MRALRLCAAAAILWLVLVMPNFPAALGWGMLSRVPLELPVILLVLMVLAGTRAVIWLRAVLVAVLGLLVVLKGADLISFDALSRPFNPVSDLFLVDAFARLLTGSLGLPLALAAMGAAVLGLLVLLALLWAATGVWARVALQPLARRGAGAVAVLAAAVVAVDVEARLAERDWSPPGTALSARIGVQKVQTARDTVVEMRAFRAAMLDDTFRDRRDLLGLIDRDTIVIFVESYGRTSFDTDFYAEMHRETLARYEARLSDAGLSMRSGFLQSPTQGGQSWLAHGTFANGLWIDNQISYHAALGSGRETLFHHAGNNGFRTAVVMPQITLDWPESARMGFEDIVVFDDLGYRGDNFNWVTMPDQFTLHAMDRLLRADDDARPLFAQVALVSSHAPWTPVPTLLPWDEIGDGTEFNAMAASGDPPEVVWRDRERVREQYRLAVDYALQVVFEYALLHAQEPPLLLIVGDHQAAARIALDERVDVPLHVIGPAALVDALAEAAPDPGLLPGDAREALPMDHMRDLILDAYSEITVTGLEPAR